MRVLLVAEAFDVRYWFEGALSRSGRTYAVTWVSSLDEATARLEHAHYDVCVVDVGLGDGRGMTLVQSQVVRGFQVPFLALLDRADVGREAMAIRVGAMDVLVRGDDSPGGIERAVRAVVERARLARALRVTPTALAAVDEGVVLDRVEVARARAKRRKLSFAVAAVSLDGLLRGSLDDQLTDLAGIADALAEVSGAQDAILRTGPEQFVALIEGVEGRNYRGFGERVAAAIAARIGGARVVPRVGLAFFPEHERTAASLLESARAAVPASTGEVGIGIHGEGGVALGSRAAEVRRLLPQAVRSWELFLVYQPQVRISDGHVVGVEALLRWRSPELGLVPPTEFIPVAEELGLISDIGGRILLEACQQARTWQQQGLPLRVGVNVSPRQFADGSLESVVRGALTTSGLSAELLELEITEGVLLENTDAARTVLDHLRALGVVIAVDDFGTGYSSFTYVKRLPMDVIKIDREFIRGLPLDAENAAISAAIVALANSLSLEVIAEGVETESEEEFLRSLGCGVVQGYLHGRPMGVPEFESWRAGRRVSMIEPRRSIAPLARAKPSG